MLAVSDCGGAATPSNLATRALVRPVELNGEAMAGAALTAGEKRSCFSERSKLGSWLGFAGVTGPAAEKREKNFFMASRRSARFDRAVKSKGDSEDVLPLSFPAHGRRASEGWQLNVWHVGDGQPRCGSD